MKVGSYSTVTAPAAVQVLTADEARALDELFRSIARGADPRVIARTEPARSIWRKVRWMLAGPDVLAGLSNAEGHALGRERRPSLRLLDDHNERALSVDGSSVDGRRSGVTAADQEQPEHEKVAHGPTVSQESLRARGDR